MTVPELKAYLSIYFYMGIQHLSDWRDYWSTDEILNHPFVSNLMIRNRFEEINKNFHLADNTANPDRGRAGHNPLHRVQPSSKFEFNWLKIKFFTIFFPLVTSYLASEMGKSQDLWRRIVGKT